MQKKPFVAGAPPRTSLGDHTALPSPDPLAGEGRGWLPLPKNPIPALGPFDLGLWPRGPHPAPK